MVPVRGLTRSMHGLAVSAAMAVFLLTGCGGGEDSSAALADTAGGAGATAGVNADSLAVTIDGVTIDNGAPEVSFSIKDQDGLAYDGLNEDDLRFTIAQLQVADTGHANWQSYINKTEEAGSVGSGTTDTVQANYEKASEGTFVNNGDGTYNYTFATDITHVSDPKTVTYDATLTHRLAMQIEGDSPVTNAIYTWQPSTGTTQGITTRDIVTVDSCNECHNKLATHGGGRIDTRYCVTCHNPGTTDANSGNTVDFKVMIHKLHAGANLPSVLAGGSYVIYGHRDSEHDFSDVVFPQDVRNCTKCHNGLDAATPDGDNWKTKPSRAACGSCHDDVDFAAGTNHPGGVQTTDANCTVCHTSTVAYGPENAHTLTLAEEAEDYRFNILNVTNTAPGQFPVVTYSVTKPLNGSKYDIATTPALSNGSLTIDLGWSTASSGTDYTNEGGSAPARAVQLDAEDPSAANVTDNGDSTYTVTSDVAVPSAATGSGVVAFEGYAVYDLNGDGSYGHDERVPVKSQATYFAITDSSASSRRQVVDTAKCQSCHENLSLHGGNRNDNVEVCVVCHNPNNTDIQQRPAAGEEESIDFKRLIHGIHAGSADNHGFRETGLVVYGYGNNEFDFGHVRFPGILSDCSTCHVDGTYELPLSSDVSPSVIDTTPAGTDSDPAAVDSDLSNDRVITATAAACSSCHDSDAAQSHMEQNGAAFGVDRGTAAASTEVCEACHGPSGVLSVSTAHGID